METKTCILRDWNHMPGASTITAVSISGNKFKVDGAHAALKFFCEYWIKKGMLTADFVHGLHFKWLKLHADEMECPTHLPHGIDLIMDGSGSTPLMRMNLLAERLNITAECHVEYVHDMLAGFGNKSQNKFGILERWMDTEDEPDDQVQKRLHELDVLDCSFQTPYELSIGGERYAVNGWSGLIETFVLWVMLRFPNGQDRIKACQDSKNWRSCCLCNIDYTIHKVAFSGPDWSAVECMKSLMELLCIDRYSVYIKCTRVTEAERASDGENSCMEDGQPSLSEDLPPGTVAANELQDEQIEYATIADLPSKTHSEPQKTSRHFIPIFHMGRGL